MHTIRLRGPWELEPIERYLPRGNGVYDRSNHVPPRNRATMPADWCAVMEPDFLGVVRYGRTVYRPTNLSGERVWLVVEPARSLAVVRVNGEVLGRVRFGSELGRFDITPLLVEHNRVEIDVEHPALDENQSAPDDDSRLVPGGLTGEVRLEIDG
jgi:hypothetical protein